VTILEGVGLGTLQGITEFLPVSSKSHLVLAEKLFGIQPPGAPAAWEVLLHAASLVAILIYLRREILSLLTTRRRLVPALLVGTIPAVVLAVLFKPRLETLLKSPLGIGLGLLLTGTVLWVSERLATDRRPIDSVGVADGFWIGLAQAIALAPGVSRSGMTIGAGLASGLERGAAVAFGFLLGAIAIAGATVLKLREIAAVPKGDFVPMALGFGASLGVSLAALWLLTLVVRHNCLFYFTIYCYAVGIAVLLAKFTGVW